MNDEEEVDDEYDIHGLQNVDFRILRKKRLYTSELQSPAASDDEMQYDIANSNVRLFYCESGITHFVVSLALQRSSPLGTRLVHDAMLFYVVVDGNERREIWGYPTYSRTLGSASWTVSVNKIHPGAHTFTFFMFDRATEIASIQVHVPPTHGSLSQERSSLSTSLQQTQLSLPSTPLVTWSYSPGDMVNAQTSLLPPIKTFGNPGVVDRAVNPSETQNVPVYIEQDKEEAEVSQRQRFDEALFHSTLPTNESVVGEEEATMQFTHHRLFPEPDYAVPAGTLTRRRATWLDKFDPRPALIDFSDISKVPSTITTTATTTTTTSVTTAPSQGATDRSTLHNSHTQNPMSLFQLLNPDATTLRRPKGIDSPLENRKLPPPSMSPVIYNGSFQQPFITQDLWNPPMTEWDWLTDLSPPQMPGLDGGDLVVGNPGPGMQQPWPCYVCHDQW